MTRRTDNRTTRLPVPAGEIPTFDPVPIKPRSDGWTPERQRDFIAALADTGSVEAACKAVNMSTVGAYRIRRLPEGASFRAAWDAALECGVQRLEDVAMDRALNGVEETLHYHGQEVGKRRKYNDRLLMFMLRNRAPERYAVGVNGGKGAGALKGLNAVGKMEKRRLKNKWRKKWEKDWGKEQLKREVATMESINAKIDRIREKEERLESPRVRALREALDEAVREDKANRYSAYRDPEHELYRMPRHPDDMDVMPYELSEGETEEDYAGIVSDLSFCAPEAEGEEADGDGRRVRTLKDNSWT
ncbi:hypothetical protein [Erythrobacter litoralis]|uniref:Uncharacterized protein n=1 Tax=Erythrobacter litoralis (strain HTCC2594) TaxID=314225 RepID=Q2N9V0_ERYLH|nr:hypothetical protein [Erythrobacter litoralis]ABC63541.1 hypothetical protein ELI_07245 [Erythrobacter litoralis HTCC2594]